MRWILVFVFRHRRFEQLVRDEYYRREGLLDGVHHRREKLWRETGEVLPELESQVAPLARSFLVPWTLAKITKFRP